MSEKEEDGKSIVKKLKVRQSFSRQSYRLAQKDSEEEAYWDGHADGVGDAIGMLNDKQRDKEKKEHEVDIANLILSPTLNAKDDKALLEFAWRYMKLLKESAKISGIEYAFSEARVYGLLATMDERFEEMNLRCQI